MIHPAYSSARKPKNKKDN